MKKIIQIGGKARWFREALWSARIRSDNYGRIKKSQEYLSSKEKEKWKKLIYICQMHFIIASADRTMVWHLE